MRSCEAVREGADMGCFSQVEARMKEVGTSCWAVGGEVGCVVGVVGAGMVLDTQAQGGSRQSMLDRGCAGMPAWGSGEAKRVRR